MSECLEMTGGGDIRPLSINIPKVDTFKNSVRRRTLNIQQTSLEAWQDLQPELTGRRKMILDALIKLKQASDYEIARYLGKSDPNFVRPRRNELYKSGVLSCAGKRKCKITGKTVMVWGLSNDKS